MNRLFNILPVIGLLVLIFSWGYAASFFRIFPWELVNPAAVDVRKFLRGDPSEAVSSAYQKIISDQGGMPYRYLLQSPGKLKVPNDAKEFTISNKYAEIKGFNNGAPEGYILLNGGFYSEDTDNANVVLISTSGEYIRHWQDKISMFTTVDHKRKKIITGHNMTSQSWCNSHENTPVDLYMERTHHSIEVAPDGTYWTSNGVPRREGIVQFNPNKLGEDNYMIVKREITLSQITKNNKDVSPFFTRTQLEWDPENDPGKRNPSAIFLKDPFHMNDVQPFVDERFPTKLGYALLVSVRNLNLIFVLDPVTKKVLWFNQGQNERQHDIDYVDGDIYVFDNGPLRGYSRLTRTNFEGSKFETVIDGRNYDWFDPTGGSHDTFSYKEKLYHLITNIKMGRAQLFDKDSNLLFEVQNLLRGDDGKGIEILSASFITVEEYESLESDCKK